MKSNYIQDAQDLHDHFFYVRGSSRQLSEGIMVNNEVRKEILLSVGQGSITLEGRVMKIKFTNMSGGVWLATVVNINGTSINSNGEKPICTSK